MLAPLLARSQFAVLYIFCGCQSDQICVRSQPIIVEFFTLLSVLEPTFSKFIVRMLLWLLPGSI